MAPIIADAEAGFGGPLNAYELMRAMIASGAAGVHFEDQLASEKKCGHLGGKVLVPISQHIRTLNAARLAADVEGVNTVLLCRTDAQSAQLLTSDVDERDRPFISDDRTAEGFFRIKPGVGNDYAIARGLAYAPYSDLLWWETSEPDLREAERFANEIHKQFPGKMLAYNCSPSFNWKKKLPADKIAAFQREIGKMGYRFQFVTLAGFHSLNLSMFNLARGYKERGMAAYSELQQAEFAAEADGYTATRHQREVGVGYFDAVAMAISGGKSSTTAFAGSTEARSSTTMAAPRRRMTITTTASCTITNGPSPRNNSRSSRRTTRWAAGQHPAALFLPITLPDIASISTEALVDAAGGRRHYSRRWIFQSGGHDAHNAKRRPARIHRDVGGPRRRSRSRRRHRCALCPRGAQGTGAGTADGQPMRDQPVTVSVL